MTKRRRKGPPPQPLPVVQGNSILLTRVVLIALGLLVLSSFAIAVVGIFVYSARVSDSLAYAGFSIGITIWVMFWVKWEMIPSSPRYPGDTLRDQHPFSYWSKIAIGLLLVFLLERFYILHCMLEPFHVRIGE